jgi:hypothetical protein
MTTGSLSTNMDLGSAAAMTVDPTTGIVYVADRGGTNSINMLYTLDLSFGLLTPVGELGPGVGLSGLALVTIPEPSSVLLTMSALAASVPYVMGRRFKQNRCLRVGESESPNSVPLPKTTLC